MTHHVDASALVKLVVEEPETDALREWITGVGGDLTTSDLARTEVTRATRRHAPDRLRRAWAVLDSVGVAGVPTRVFAAAGRTDPPTLRSLDAIHLAAALEMGDDLDGIVTYDDRLADAAGQLGIPVLAPS